MTRIRTANEIVQDLLNFYYVAQPDLDISPGSYERDTLIDGFALEQSKLYDELNLVSTRQSFRLSIGQDVDNFLQNFKESRKKGTKGQVLALCTFDSLDADISLPKGGKIYAKNGVTFTLLNTTLLSPVLLNLYQSTAIKFKSDLDFLGITDKYAISVLAEASVIGSAGKISKYNLISTDLIGIDHVTNVYPGSGGNEPETDIQAKNRFFSILSGGAAGTSLGYKNTILQDPSVIDAVVIEPGDTLMTRDGTQVAAQEDGSKVIISEGAGSKIDIIVFGSRLEQNYDSFIYKDKSNSSDPTNSKNDWTLGQIVTDSGKSVSQKRLQNLNSGILPSQPINNIISIEGSQSGPNFQNKTTDIYGRTFGNYELIKDTGNYAGSPWGFDRLHWIDNKITNYPEDKTKNIFNGQDALAYSDILQIKKVEQNVFITNENSKVSTKDKSIIQLNHTPCSSVTRVFNVTTGEKYIIENQNPDGNGIINITGNIKISGKTLPSIKDILQIDYTWILSYDPNFDFDNKINTTSIRESGDSLDWGFSNSIKKERVVLNSSGSFLIAELSLPATSITDVNTFIDEAHIVTLKSNRLAIVVDQPINNVSSIKIISSNLEIWNTKNNDGTFKGSIIFLPTDTLASINDSVYVTYNLENIWTEDGSVDNNIIYLNSNVAPGTIVECNYFANINFLLPATILNNLPIIKNNNKFQVLNNIFGYQPCSFIYNGENIINNLRTAPTYLGFNLLGDIAPGAITVSGKIIFSIFDVIITSSNNGLKLDLSSAIRKYFSLNSIASIDKYSIVKIIKVEKVTTFSTSSDEVLKSNYTFDLNGYQLKDNLLDKNNSIINETLKSYVVNLPETTNNLNNKLNIGDKLRISFYIASQESENIFFSKQGTQYSKYKYISVDLINITTGLSSTGSQTSTLTIFNINQPATKSRYKVYYDYLAPKPNERITVTYNYDKLIGDLTLQVDENRIIGSDILLKTANPIAVDASVSIVISSEYLTKDYNLVLLNVKDVITNALRFNRNIVDASDLIALAANVIGVDRVRITYFNKAGKLGTKLSLIPEKNEYFYPNNIIVTQEIR